MPSDLGYRLYVESLMREAALDRTDQLMIRHQFSQVQLTSNEWLRLAASILAASTRSAAVVTPARARRARFGHIQLVELADHARLCVLVLADGKVRAAPPGPRPAGTARDATRRSARRTSTTVAATLNAELPSLSAPQVRRRIAGCRRWPPTWPRW